MKSKTLLILLFLLLISCNQNKFNNESIIILEKDNFIIYTSKDDLDFAFKSWLTKNKDNNFIGIKNDQKLYTEICEKYTLKQVNAFNIANELNVLKRLNYITANLLEQKKAFVYNTRTKENEYVQIKTFNTGRDFVVKNNIVLEVFDITY